MTQKRWKLSVTELGSSNPVAETVVEAGDWMTGLGRARLQIGEKGGVPQGASVSVSPEGTVSVVDPVARRRYSLVVTAEPLPGAKPASVPPPAPAPAAKAAKQNLKRTMAYVPGENAPALAPKPASVPPPAAARSPVSAAAAPAGSSAPIPAAASAGPSAAQGGGPARVSVPAPAKKVSKATMAYVPASSLAPATVATAAAAHPAAATPAAAPVEPSVAATPAAAAPASGPAPVDAPAAREPVAAPAVREPVAAPLPTAAASPSPTTGSGPLLAILFERDSEPSAESPLIYRERNWLVDAALGEESAEALLRAEFARIQTELASRPRGKLVKLALFDHRWSVQPERPPVLVLTWKDWRGAPEVLAPARVSMVAVGPAAPAPGAPSVMPTAPATHTPAQGATRSADLSAEPRRSTPPISEAASIVVDPGLMAERTLEDLPQAAPLRSAPPAPAAKSATTTGPHSSSRVFKRTPQPTKSDDRLATAFEGLQDLFFLPTPADGADFTLRLLGELIPSEASSIALYDINTDELRFVAAHGVGADERKGDAVPAQMGILGTAIHDHDACLVLSDVSTHPRFDPGIDGRVGLEANNIAIMPIAHSRRLLGAVQLMNRIGDLEFSQSDANLLAYISERFGEFLHQHKVAEHRRPSAKSIPGRR